MNVSTLTSAILGTMPEMNKYQRDFFVHIMETYLTMRGRYNFLNMERYGGMNELTYRNHFSRDFDFESFNLELIERFSGPVKATAFDPSYISKSGKKTPGVGYFWSGCAGKNKWGLELCGFAGVDIKNNTALHYFATQTLPAKGQGLLDFYCNLIRQKAPALKKVSKYLLVDAYFSKKPFVDAALQSDLHLVSRLRDDGVLFYLPAPRKEGQKGRNPGKGARIDPKNLDATQLALLSADAQRRVYGGALIIQSLGRKVVANIVQELRADGSVRSAKVFFCTDPDFPAHQVLNYYQSRFQIEFLYRDAKQHTGLQNCQSRQQNALHYHFNLSLTAVSIAKAVHHLSIEKDLRQAFSMADIKTQYFNELMVDSIFQVFAKSPNPDKYHPDIQKLYNLGKIAA